MADLFSPDTPIDHAPRLRPRDAVFLRVAVERGLTARGDDDEPAGFAHTLTYIAPREPAPVLGQRAIVPLGRGNTPTAGFIVAVGGPELAGTLDASAIKPIVSLEPATLPPRLVELARWMADYYICPLGMVFATMVPASVKRSIGAVSTRVVTAVGPVRAGEILAGSALPPQARRAWDELSGLGLTEAIEPRALQQRLGLKTLGPINRLIEAGLLEVGTRRDVRVRGGLYAAAGASEAVPPDPTPEQARAVAGIVAALGSFSVHLVHGVTGSGKTEVYLRAIAAAIEGERQALVLVPEISLTPQTAGRFIARFGRGDPRRVAVLHSGLSPSERHRQWSLAASPECRVVVGARSAVFAPLPRLGLIVVDEEHATDYKQDQLPRYHARDTAIKRAQLESCPVVLGSATPSLESWLAATPDPQGQRRMRYWSLPSRVGGGSMPSVEIVDLAGEHRAGDRRPGVLPAIGARLRQALLHTLCDGGQAIMLLNRRGFASHVACQGRGCGFVLTCRDCDAAMVLHTKVGAAAVPRGVLRCHHCLAEQTAPARCPMCQSALVSLGVGTQRVEDELSEILRAWPDLAVDPAEALARVDSDTMRSARDYFDLLARFAAGEVRILLGTQMIAKGLDFPNVRLVGVINADIGLAAPDFRVAERTFQLICQVAGRAGRGQHAGRVIIQTVNPSDPAIVLAARHDYASFARRELGIRGQAGLPPHTRLARIVVRDTSHQAAADRAAGLAEELQRHAPPGCTILGPAEAPIARIARFHRVAIEVFAPSAAALQRTLHALASRGILTSDARTAVDVDPVALM